MAYQLVYTSSPRGLKPGAFGFCVVACTRGMREQTSSALEALSGYRRVFADPRDALRNPTACSHVLFDTPTGRLRILSRVADAGLDYSGRTNKIACFLDVAPNELTPPGPAALFSAPGLFVTNWPATNAPQYYEAPTAIPNFVPIPSGCDEWRKTTGDAGWAGALASTVASRRPAILVVRPDQNVLRLFQESLALLPPGERWNATFSTYYMKAPPGVQCQWKAVMQGSPEESAFRATPGVLILDLTAPNRLPDIATFAATPEVQALVAAARGVNPSVAVPTQLPNDRVFRPVPNAATAPSPFGAAPTPNSPLPGAMPIGAKDTYDLASPIPTSAPVPPGATRRRKTLNYGRDAILTVDAPPQRSATLLTKILACVGAAAILLGVVLAFLIAKGFIPVVEYVDDINKNADVQTNVQEQPKASSPTSEETKPEDAASGKSGAQGKSQGSTTTSEEANPENEASPATPSTTEPSKGAEKGEAVENESKDGAPSPTSGSEDSSTSADADATAEQATESPTSPTPQARNSASRDSLSAEKNQSMPSAKSGQTGQNGDSKKNSEGAGDNAMPSRAASDTKAPDDKKASKNNVRLDDVADEIETSLTAFINEGGLDKLEEIKKKVKKYRVEKDKNEELNASIAHYEEITDALKFNSFKIFEWNTRKAKEKLNSSEEIKVDDVALHHDLTKFFASFPEGVIRLSFRLYEKNGSKSKFQCSISAKEFNEIKNRPDPPKTVEEPLEDEVTSSAFYVDLHNKIGGLRFKSSESLKKWLLHGTVEIEALANSEDSSLVYYVPETPVLNCSDLTADFSAVDSLELGWLFGKSSVPFSESDANSLFVEYVPKPDSILTLVTSPKELREIVPKRSNANNKTFRVIKGREWSMGTLGDRFDYAFSVSFVSNTNEINEKFQFHRAEYGKWKEDDKGSPPGGLEERVLVFNVRYRSCQEQETETMPIVGVLKVPIVFSQSDM